MTNDTANRYFALFCWVLAGFLLLVPFVAWSSLRGWQFGGLTGLAVFPLLGLWAWSLMWSHYALAAVRILNPQLIKNKTYSMVSGYAVLLLILLHPALIYWNLWTKQDKLPPLSVYSYVGSSLKLFVVFGSVALTLFLAYEVLERIKNRPLITRYWPWISLSQMLAMTLVFIHAVALGRTLGISWFEFYWVILGALLIPCFGLVGRLDWRPPKR